ncbi:hypothetical protein C8Q75DRAFT_765179 [Abortiporus biennis]|nr:hypothetical protein C8Q75DRAFT_765179 [Abortiporus biennis]
MDLGTNDSQHDDHQRTIHFPVELYERIMGNLNPRRPGDRNMLVNCCLTCKSWLPYARWCLYSLVVIAEFQKPSCLLLINSLRRSSFLANLVLRLESTFPPLKGDSNAGAYHTVLQQVATLMRRLQELTLRGLPQLHPSTIPLLSSLRFQTVTILKLVDTTFHSFQAFRQFISAFPQLDVLILKQVDWLSQFVGTSLRSSNPKKNTLALSSFELWVKSELIVDIITRWIFTTPSVLSLRRITISQYPDKSGRVDWHRCEPLLRGCRNVEILEIRNCRYPWSHELF